MSCRNTAERVSGNIFIRPNFLAKAGDVTEGHEHEFDHTTFVIRGAINVKGTHADGGSWDRDVHAGGDVLILKGVRHTIAALEDDTAYYCIYSHRDFDGNVVEHPVGNEAAYR